MKLSNIVIVHKPNLEPNDGEKISRKFKASRDLMSFNRIPVIIIGRFHVNKTDATKTILNLINLYSKSH